MSVDSRRRLNGLQEKMEEYDLDLVVYGSCQNFQYLTGLLIDWRHGIDLGSAANLVLVPRSGEPTLTVGEEWESMAHETWIKDVRTLGDKENYAFMIDKVLKEFGLSGKKVGVGDHVWGSTFVELSKALK